jgi:hypothetical protein
MQARNRTRTALCGQCDPAREAQRPGSTGRDCGANLNLKGASMKWPAGRSAVARQRSEHSTDAVNLIQPGHRHLARRPCHGKQYKPGSDVILAPSRAFYLHRSREFWIGYCIGGRPPLCKCFARSRRTWTCGWALF